MLLLPLLHHAIIIILQFPFANFQQTNLTNQKCRRNTKRREIWWITIFSLALSLPSLSWDHGSNLIGIFPWSYFLCGGFSCHWQQHQRQHWNIDIIYIPQDSFSSVRFGSVRSCSIDNACQIVGYKKRRRRICLTSRPNTPKEFRVFWEWGRWGCGWWMNCFVNRLIIVSFPWFRGLNKPIIGPKGKQNLRLENDEVVAASSAAVGDYGNGNLTTIE